MSELKETQTNDTQDIVVSLGNNSVVQLVNGGVSLPEGVDQQFYVVANEAQAK